MTSSSRETMKARLPVDCRKGFLFIETADGRRLWIPVERVESVMEPKAEMDRLLHCSVFLDGDENPNFVNCPARNVLDALAKAKGITQ